MRLTFATADKCRPSTLMGAHLAKEYGVHGHDMFVRKCVFDFKWAFFPDTTFWDCTKAKTLDNKQRGIYLSANIALERCNLKEHTGYVRVFPSMPASVMVPGKEGKLVPKVDTLNKLKFHINVEGWTAGSCSGSKAPGVRWMFTYLVDLSSFTIRYVTVMKETDSQGRRPTLAENTYILQFPETSADETQAEWTLREPYQEHTIGFAHRLGIDIEE